jgi:hypothetical protein
MVSGRFHGTISIILIFIALGIGTYFIYSESSLLFVSLYLLILIWFILSASLFYCTKCPVREMCNHVILGMISRALFKEKVGERYTKFDLIFGVGLPSLFAFGFPQYWLYSNIIFLILFWVLIGFSGLEISLFVCTVCENRDCTLCRNPTKK